VAAAAAVTASDMAMMYNSIVVASALMSVSGTVVAIQWSLSIQKAQEHTTVDAKQEQHRLRQPRHHASTAPKHITS
jgi:hypothetical protein